MGWITSRTNLSVAGDASSPPPPTVNPLVPLPSTGCAREHASSSWPFAGTCIAVSENTNDLMRVPTSDLDTNRLDRIALSNNATTAAEEEVLAGIEVT